MMTVLDGVTPWPADLAVAYRRLGYWRGETHAGFLAERAVAHPDRVAVVDDARAVTYRQLAAAAERLASGLAGLGIAAGDRVVVQLPNRVSFLEVVLGLFRLGALPVFALPAHRDVELGFFAEHTEAVACVVADVVEGFDHRELALRVADRCASLRLVVVDGDPGGDPRCRALDGLLAGADPGPGPDPADVAFLQLSGGSTGVPKLIPRTHDEYVYTLRESAAICALGPASVYLAVLPAAHNFTLSSPGILGTLYAGGRVVMCPSPRADVAFAAIARHGVTITAVVPALANAWVAAAAAHHPDLRSLQVLQVGGAKLAPAVARQVGPALGCELQQVFGMAEGLVNYTRLGDPERLVVETQGRPISPADELLVVDDDDRPVAPGASGHLLTRGPYTIRGYYRADDHNRRAFTPDGFYRTGDIVRITPEGYVQVIGRAKDQINRAGEKIAVEEVEAHILEHPGVADVAVVGVPDEHLGERSHAYVVAAAGAELGAVAVKRFLRERGIAAFKVPDKVEIVDALPHTAVGKTAKRSLRARTPTARGAAP